MIAFNDLKRLHADLEDEIASAVARVLRRGWYVLGPEVEAFENAFAAYHGLPHAVAVASGTDAVELALRAGGVGPGDEVITVAHTAVPTVCAIERAGARPVFADIDPRTCTLCPGSAAAALTPRTRAIVPVHLYGHPADMAPILSLARRRGLLVVEDCAQAHGARYHGTLAGAMGDLGAFSFYPTKNLGACGDGGAVITRDAALAARLRRLRNYGQAERYQHLERGVNSRLDEVQAAILSVKLVHLDRHNAARRDLAALYHRVLRRVALPAELDGMHHVYHLYVVRTPDRDGLRARLRAAGIEALVHYPVPVHCQPAYRDLGYRWGSLPQTERAADEVLSLPLHVGLTADKVQAVADVVSRTVVREAA